MPQIDGIDQRVSDYVAPCGAERVVEGTAPQRYEDIRAMKCVVAASFQIVRIAVPSRKLGADRLPDIFDRLVSTIDDAVQYGATGHFILVECLGSHRRDASLVFYSRCAV